MVYQIDDIEFDSIKGTLFASVHSLASVLVRAISEEARSLERERET